MDEVHIIESDGSLYLSTLEDTKLFIPPLLDALEMVQNDKRPLKIINAYKKPNCIYYKA